MKLVKKDRLAIISAHSDAFIAIRNALVESNEGVDPEEVTAETIIEALKNPESIGELTEAQGLLAEIEAKLTESEDLLTAEREALQKANDRIAELETEMAELDETPATEPATITPQSDAGGETQTIAEYANQNKGNTQDILARAKKDGLI